MLIILMTESMCHPEFISGSVTYIKREKILKRVQYDRLKLSANKLTLTILNLSGFPENL